MCGNDCDPQHGYCVEPGECKCNLGYQVEMMMMMIVIIIMMMMMMVW